MKIKDSEVKKILAEVETEIGALLKSESDRLAKGHEESPGEGSASEGSAGGPPEGSLSAPPGPEDTSGAPPMDGSGAPPVDDGSGAPPMDPSAPPDGAVPPPGAFQDPAADQGPVDPEMLMAEYAKLPPEELKVHYMAAKAALAQVMGGDPDGQGAIAPPPSPSPAGPPSPSPSPSPAPLAQAEVPADMKNLPANGGSQKAAVPDAIKSETAVEGTALAKAQKDFDEKSADLEKQIELLVKAVDMVIGQPIRKAVTGVSFVPRTVDPKAEPSKDEINAKLGEVIRGRKLSKSESERAIAYSMGHIGYEQIKDLLEKK